MTRRAIIHMSAEVLRGVLGLPENIEIVGITRSEKHHGFDVHLLGTSEDSPLPVALEGETSLWVTVAEIRDRRWVSP